jgi:hypothetical protein
MRRTLVLALAVFLLAVLGWLLGRSSPRTEDEQSPARVAEATTERREQRVEEALLEPADDAEVFVEKETTPPPPPETPPPSAEAAAEVVLVPTGRVVDARTGEGVPEIDVALASGETKVNARTDAAGWFGLEATDAISGSCSIHLADDSVPLLAQTLDPAVDPLPWVLEVPIGPTYPLQFVDPMRGRAERARLVESARDEGVAGELLVLSDEIAIAPEDAPEDRVWTWRTVRPGPLPWIRYPSVEHEPEGRLGKRIEADSGGAWHHGLALDTVGIQRPVALHFVEGRMTISGWVLDEKDDPVAGAFVLLLPPAETAASSVWYEARSAPAGSFTFAEVPRRHWRIFVWSLGAALVDEYVPQDPSPKPIVVRMFEGNIARSQESPLGARLASGKAVVLIEMTDCAPFARKWLLPPMHLPPPRCLWIESFVGIGAPLPLGGAADPNDSFFFGLERRRANPAAEGTFLRIEAVDGPTGVPLDGAEVHFGPSGDLVTRRASEGPWPFREESRLEWMVARPGCASAFGNEHSFATEDEARVARATLWPGWGAALYFRAGPPAEVAHAPDSGITPELTTDVVGVLTAAPIPGVEVHADGVAIETSDELGAVHLALDHAPLRLTLVRRHWRLTGLERLTVPGSAALRYVVWLEPERP